MSFTSDLVPESKAGRKPIPCDPDAVEYLVRALLEDAIVEIDGEPRAKMHGPNDRTFQTESRAVSEGKRYAKAVGAILGKNPATKPLPVEVTREVTDEDGNTVEETETRYVWRLYYRVEIATEVADANAGRLAQNEDDSENEDEDEEI